MPVSGATASKYAAVFTPLSIDNAALPHLNVRTAHGVGMADETPNGTDEVPWAIRGATLVAQAL